MALKFVNVRELHNKTSEILRLVERGEHQVIITSRGKPRALLTRFTEEDLEDYVLTHSPEFQKLIEDAYREAQEGQVISLEELIARTEEEIAVPGSSDPTGSTADPSFLIRPDTPTPSGSGGSRRCPSPRFGAKSDSIGTGFSTSGSAPRKTRYSCSCGDRSPQWDGPSRRGGLPRSTACGSSPGWAAPAACPCASKQSPPTD